MELFECGLETLEIHKVCDLAKKNFITKAMVDATVSQHGVHANELLKNYIATISIALEITNISPRLILNIAQKNGIQQATKYLNQVLKTLQNEIVAEQLKENLLTIEIILCSVLDYGSEYTIEKSACFKQVLDNDVIKSLIKKGVYNHQKVHIMATAYGTDQTIKYAESIKSTIENPAITHLITVLHFKMATVLGMIEFKGTDATIAYANSAIFKCSNVRNATSSNKPSGNELRTR